MPELLRQLTLRRKRIIYATRSQSTAGSTHLFVLWQVYQPVLLSAFVRSPLTMLRRLPETSRRPLRSRDLQASDMLEILTKRTLLMNGEDAIGRSSIWSRWSSSGLAGRYWMKRSTGLIVTRVIWVDGETRAFLGALTDQSIMAETRGLEDNRV